MAEIITNVILDVARPNAISTLVAKQYDTNSRFLRATICDKGERMNISRGTSVLFNVRRSDGEKYEALGSVNEDGTVKVPLIPEMLLVAGQNVCDITFIISEEAQESGEGENEGNVVKRLTTMSFTLTVQSAAAQEYANSEAYDTLVELLGEVSEYRTAEVGRQTAENGRVGVEASRVNAETNRATAESNRAAQEANRASAERNRVNAENSRISAESNRATAEANRANEESVRTVAEATRNTSEETRVNAENARATAESGRVASENDRDISEQARISREENRVNAENIRITAENARGTAEADRANAEAVRTSSETARVNAETARATDEEARVNAETARVNAETARATAEEERTTAEVERQSVIDGLDIRFNEKMDKVYAKTAFAIACTATGADLQITGGANVPPLKCSVCGRTTQDGTPTPTAPIEIECVKQGTRIGFYGKNLFDKSTAIEEVANGTQGQFWFTKITNKNLSEILRPNTSYVLSYDYELVSRPDTAFTSDGNKNGLYISSPTGTPVICNYNWGTIAVGKHHFSFTFTTPSVLPSFTQLSAYSETHTGYTHATAIITNIQLELGTEETAYEPYCFGGVAVAPCDLYEGDIWYPTEGRVEKRNKLFTLPGDKSSWSAIDGLDTWVGGVYNTAMDSLERVGYKVYTNIGGRKYEIAINSDYRQRVIWLTGNTFTDYRDNFTGDSFKILIKRRNTQSPVTEEYPPQEITMLKPMTNIVSCGANMDIEYIADTKMYIDKRINELATAIVASNGGD